MDELIISLAGALVILIGVAWYHIAKLRKEQKQLNELNKKDHDKIN
jgi:hypothetical protein